MHSKLARFIQKSIQQNRAPIGFDQFMASALYHPTLGYYRSGAEKFGERGDFITAPETSDLFGFCLAKECVNVFDGQNATNDILEFGAGSGVLAAQILFELGRLNQLPRTYFILELSAELQHRQRQTLEKSLPELMHRIVWLQTLPTDFVGVVIANEVLDAMPAKRFIYQRSAFVELGVDYQNDAFEWRALNSLPANLPKSLSEQLPEHCIENYTTEINPAANAWIKSLFDALDCAVVLLIDYGMGAAEYFHPQRNNGTLRCYHQHVASENPFINIGAQDITTHVNFSAISAAAQSSGFHLVGYATQAMFLISLGIEQYLRTEKNQNKRAMLAQQIKQLVLPSAMGESFKVLALAKNKADAPHFLKCRGFREQDLRHKL